MTLDEFLLNSWPSNGWVEEPGFKGLYVRKSKRYWQDKLVPCIDLANVSVKKPGNGTFSALVAKLHIHYNLCVECVMSERFEEGLKRLGFIPLPNQGGYPSYFLEKI